MYSEIEIKIRQLIKDKLGKDESQITDEATFREDLEVDSLDFTELIVSIEKEFQITISEDLFDRLKTVGALNQQVAKLVDPYAVTDTKPAKEPKTEKVIEHEPELEEQDAV